ncbi:hypothetical protein [Chitinophaga nivalis]|uniref:Uncharacterized protein n=1 Tax=Chitinophaga nivalis TaxID=2991709 RepID=A0ABT3IJG1_9BACT|nr:hypothetical protein [Chitinophaga nivalis]MCW3466226.1 hypothetical protein [Chitinophaga nivalis]MCW3484083.1 hypothetical protein [Chitinophaga nivalis]
MGMKAATIHELKQELQALPPAQLVTLCLRLARYKKDNKELLTYLLFEASSEQTYIESIKEMIDEGFAALANDNFYIAMKKLRKVLRTAAKFIRYTGSRQVEVEVLLHFCAQLKSSGLLQHTSTALANLYAQQQKKINKAITHLHEDLQFDYQRQAARL